VEGDNNYPVAFFMASVSDTRYKQRAVIEFFVAEKEKWGTFTNGCVLCMEAVQSIEAPLDAGFRELRLQEVESVIRAVRTWLHEQELS
jgi:hypothetical protein